MLCDCNRKCVTSRPAKTSEAIPADVAKADARMAELVDATVSNTVAARRVGSTPTPGTQEKASIKNLIEAFLLADFLEDVSLTL